MVNIKKVVTAFALVVMVLLLGCVGIGGSPEIVYEGQPYQEASLTELELGFEGTMANTGSAPAENVSVVFKAELPSGETYDSVTYIGDIDDGESKDWKVDMTLGESDEDKGWDNAEWTLEIRGDNIETKIIDLETV